MFGENSRINNLAETLLNSGIVFSESEAKRMAQDMIGTENKVQDDFDARRKHFILDTKGNHEGTFVKEIESTEQVTQQLIKANSIPNYEFHMPSETTVQTVIPPSPQTLEKEEFTEPTIHELFEQAETPVAEPEQPMAVQPAIAQIHTVEDPLSNQPVRSSMETAPTALGKRDESPPPSLQDLNPVKSSQPGAQSPSYAQVPQHSNAGELSLGITPQPPASVVQEPKPVTPQAPPPTRISSPQDDLPKVDLCDFFNVNKK